MQRSGSDSKWRQQLVSGDRDSTESVTDAVLSRFNRDTRCVAAGLLGLLFLAALAFVVLVPEHHPITTDLFGGARQAKSGSSLNEDHATLFGSTDLSTNGFSSAVTSAMLPLVGQGAIVSSSPAHQPDSAQAISGKALYQKYRSGVQLGEAEAKKRLLALWHHSLLQSQKLQSWAIFSKLDKRKIATKTAQRTTFTPFYHWLSLWP